MADGTNGLLAGLSDSLAEAVERASRSTVTVHGRRRLPSTGIVWPGAERLVVTADHTLERDEDIKVTLPDGQEVGATVAGRDPGSDVAVLRLASGSPTPAEVVPAGSVKVGHFVLALGKAGEGTPGASFGIVSAVGGNWRTARGGVVDSYIRADVTLYPGFSGGPLIDARGRVIGMNSSHVARGQEIAIPAETLGNVVQALLTHGRIKRGFLGISTQPVALAAVLRQRLALAQETGLMVIGVEPGSPAEQGGLLQGDIVIALGGQAIGDPEELQAALGPAIVGQATVVRVIRGGESKDVSVTPGERA